MTEQPDVRARRPDGALGQRSWEPEAGDGRDGDSSREAWAGRGRIVLTPIAAPSILGTFGFSCATFMVGSLLAGWWGVPVLSAPALAPLVIFLGGIAQFLAAMWSYKARDGVATAVFGTWGTFWLAWGSLVLLAHGGFYLPTVLTSRAFGFWFIVMCLITAFMAVASFTQNLGMFCLLVLLSAGSGLLAASYVGAIPAVAFAGGWVLVASAAAGFYTGFAMILRSGTGGRTILPLGTPLDAAGNIPGRKGLDPLNYPQGMPGAKVGQ